LWKESMRREHAAPDLWDNTWGFLKKEPTLDGDRGLYRRERMASRKRANYGAPPPELAPSRARQRTLDPETQEREIDLLTSYRRREYSTRAPPVEKYDFPQSTSQEMGWDWSGGGTLRTLERFDTGEFRMKRSRALEGYSRAPNLDAEAL